jgi:stage IV sporulation protein FB
LATFVGKQLAATRLDLSPVPYPPAPFLLPVYFSEPQPTPFDLNFSLLGIPVRVSPWFWLGSAIFGYGMTEGDPRQLFLWEIAVFISILVHEMGHAVVIRHFGESPRVVLMLMGGLAIGGGRRGSGEQIAISAAGPIAQILLAVLTIALVRASGHSYPWPIPFWPADWYDLNSMHLDALPFEGLKVFVLYLVWPSIVWAVINLAPVFPLDGGQIARAVMAHWNMRDGVRQSLLVSAIAGAAIAVYGFKQEQPYMGMMFAALAFDSFQTYQGTRGRW